jgi:integrase
MTITDIIDSLERHYRIKGLASARIVLSQTRHVQAAMGALELEDVTPEGIEEFQVAELEAGRSPKTVNNALGFLRAAWRLALRKRRTLIREPYIDQLEAYSDRHGIFTPDEFRRSAILLETIDRTPRTVDDWPVADAFRWAYFSGWRRAMVLGLCWREVDLEKGWISLGPKRVKNRREFVVCLGDEQRGILERRLRYSRGRYVFQRRGRRLVDFRDKWAHVRELLGRHVYFHDTRRSFATLAEDAGLSAKEIMETACWADRRSLNFYSQVAHERQKRALNRFAEFVREGTHG